MITTNKYGHKLVTIQVTLGEDDVAFMQDVIEAGDAYAGILEHIVEQYHAVLQRGETK
jgi:hypothetical protein